ncbi:MAG: hypothetical protein R3346_04885 [Candidatus Spechtbacterales bacterium]|nr:hypothetical protein [Candidatus Spechtbacterales bacterium]
MRHASLYENPKAETLLKEADHIDAIADRLSTNYKGSMMPGLGFYHPNNDKEAIEEAEKILGRPWKRDRSNMPGNFERLSFLDFDSFVKELRIEAVRLRVQAFGQKPYPIEICKHCCSAVGWVGPTIRICEGCKDNEVLRRNRYNLPSAMMGTRKSIDATKNKILSKGRKFPLLMNPDIDNQEVSLKARLLALFGERELLEQEQDKLWQIVVDPLGIGNTPEPQIGAICDVPVKYTKEATDSEEFLYLFGAIPYEWTGRYWKRRDDLQNRPLSHLFPTSFSAELDPNAFNSAWNDFVLFVHSANMEMWDNPRYTLRGEEVIVSASMGETNSRVIGKKRYTVSTSQDGTSASFTIDNLD